MEERLPSISPTRTPTIRLNPPAEELSHTTSFSSVDSGGDRGKLLIKVGGALDKFKDKARSSTDTDETRSGSQDSARRLSKLIPRRSKKKKKDKSLSNGDGDSHAISGNGANPNDLQVEAMDASHSQESLGSPHNGSGGSSMLTEDSDMESSPSRPISTLISQPSHEAYLTLSSPLITAETINVSDIDRSSPKASPVLPQASAAGRAESPTPLSLSRSATPVDKLREPFPPSPKPSKLSTVTDTDPVKSGSGLVSLFAGTSKKSPRKDSQFAERPTTPKNAALDKGMTVSGTGLTESPTTVITPPTPTDSQYKPGARRLSGVDLKIPPAAHQSSIPSSNASGPSLGSSLSHRRARSAAIPTKITGTRPLTPAPEEINTPGGSLVTPNVSAGFFSSVVSATQNAVNSLSTTFGNQTPSPHQRSKSAVIIPETDKLGTSGSEDELFGVEQLSNPTNESTDLKKQPAVATLGSGELSLSLLGISDPSDTNSMASKPDTDDPIRPRSITQTTTSTGLGSNDGSPPPQLVPSASAEELTIEKTPIVAEKPPAGTRSQSIPAAVLGSGISDHTPPRSFTHESETSLNRRNGSVRSRISNRRKKRSRGNSKDSGSTIAAAIGASYGAAATTAAPSVAALNRRPTGFAVASSKRNKDFHGLFRSVPDNDYLIEDYSAALQRDILLHGRIYISERHICFSSNILGWVTNLVISFDEVVAMEKKSTAVIFPNAIVIQTLHARNTFASFISRDTTYDLLIGIWKIGHPNLKASLNGHTLDDSGTIDKISEAEFGESEDESDEDSDFSDEDDDEDGTGSYLELREGSVMGSDAGESVRAPTVKSPTSNSATTKTTDPQIPAANAPSSDFPGPATHSATECSDQDSHYEKQLVDTTIPAPLGKVYSMMFGPTSGVIMRKFLLDDQKSGDLQMEDDKKGLGEEIKSYSYSFIKPLNGAIGPRQTKCIVSQSLDFFDLSKAVSVTCSTQTPDVPNGGLFVTKTKYCLMWGPGNSTRLIMNCTIEWSGKSWLRGPIEKGANDGQMQYGKDIVAFFRAAVAAKSPSKGAAGGKTKGKRVKRGRSESQKSTVHQDKSFSDAKDRSQSSAGGIFGSLQGIFEPAGSMLSPIMSTSGVLAILLAFMTILWFRTPNADVGRTGYLGSISPARMAAYEELWRHEESELWNWMEERLDMDSIAKASVAGGKARPASERHNDASSPVDKMNAREVDDAIRVTEQRLASFKASVERQRRKDAEASKGKGK